MPVIQIEGLEKLLNSKATSIGDKFNLTVDIPEGFTLMASGIKIGTGVCEFSRSLFGMTSLTRLQEWSRSHYNGVDLYDDKGSVPLTGDVDTVGAAIFDLVCSIRHSNEVYEGKYPIKGINDFVHIKAKVVDERIFQKPIEEELPTAYLDYAMSVIVGRALPSARDGLKPVHRRVLFAMHELGNRFNASYKKSARVVGDVIGKYHPHGDGAVYDAIVRMAQEFSLRYPLVDGQGNFGSIDGDSAAAMRYTEVRMAQITNELLSDLNFNTVDYVPNYDGAELIPEVLPTAIPNLLVNGASGIAVGMATNIPPHNITEVCDAAIALMDNPDITLDELMSYVPAPDFPTGGIVYGLDGIREAYKTGRGKCYIRSRVEHEVEYGNNESIKHQALVVTEIPYQVNKANLILKIAELVKDRKIDGITNIRDESNKEGIRIVIDLRRDAIAEVVENNLYSQTQLSVSFGMNMIALNENNEPHQYSLYELLETFINFRRQIVTKRTIHEREKAEEEMELVIGRLIVLYNIEEVVKLITSCRNRRDARDKLLDHEFELSDKIIRTLGFDESMETYLLSDRQVTNILSMQLTALVGAEADDLEERYNALIDEIRRCDNILNNNHELLNVIRKELENVIATYGDSRNSEVNAEGFGDLRNEDLIAKRDMVVTLSDEGYVKAQDASEYQPQRRGGKGKSVTMLKEADTIKFATSANSHDTLLVFTSFGRMHWLRTFDLPTSSRAGRGKPIVNLLPLSETEEVTAILPVEDFNVPNFVFMATANGIVKKVALEQFSRPRASGIIAINLDEDDILIGASLTDGNADIMLFTSNGQCIRFPENQVRSMGRGAAGVIGIRLRSNETDEADVATVVSMVAPKPDEDIITITDVGYGKRTAVQDYPLKSRGGLGVRNIRGGSTGDVPIVVNAIAVSESDMYMVITDQGKCLCAKASELTLIGRNTRGVIIMSLEKDANKRPVEFVVSLQKLSASNLKDVEEEAADEDVAE